MLLIQLHGIKTNQTLIAVIKEITMLIGMSYTMFHALKSWALARYKQPHFSALTQPFHNACTVSRVTLTRLITGPQAEDIRSNTVGLKACTGTYYVVTVFKA